MQSAIDKASARRIKVEAKREAGRSRTQRHYEPTFLWTTLAEGLGKAIIDAVYHMELDHSLLPRPYVVDVTAWGPDKARDITRGLFHGHTHYHVAFSPSLATFQPDDDTFGLFACDIAEGKFDAILKVLTTDPVTA